MELAARVDAHVHLLPGRLAQKIRDFFDRLIPGALAYPIEPERVLTSHAEAGIQRIWNLPYAHKSGMSAALNESMAELRAQHSGHGVEITSGCTVHVEDTDPAALLDEAVHSFGARVCKLHCSVGNYAPDDPRFGEFWSQASALRVPVVVHAGHGVHGRTEAHELEPVGRVAQLFPDARIIIAHCGFHAYREALELLEIHENVYADLTPVLSERVPLEVDDYERHANKLLFGTDAPNTGLEAEQLLHRLESELRPETATALLGENAERLCAAVDARE